MNSSIQDIDVLSMALIGRKEVCNHSKYDDCVSMLQNIFFLRAEGGKRMKNMMDLNNSSTVMLYNCFSSFLSAVKL